MLANLNARSSFSPLVVVVVDQAARLYGTMIDCNTGRSLHHSATLFNSKKTYPSQVPNQRMTNLQPVITNKKGTRNFVCSAVALQAVVVDAEGQILLLSSPIRNPNGAWQVVSGALE